MIAMNRGSDLIHAYRLQDGGGIPLTWESLRAGVPDEAPLWLHFNRADPKVRKWCEKESGLPDAAVESLLEEETRPRCQQLENGILLILRGVNLNPGADPEDMVSLRVWADAQRVISLRRRRVLAAEDVENELKAGVGPRTTGEVLAVLVDHLVDRMGPVIEDLQDAFDGLEEEAVAGPSSVLRPQLYELRHQAIRLRRYLAPQREALARLCQEKADWLSGEDRASLHGAADRLTRFIEDFDATRERAAVIQEELANRLGEQLNERIYMLSIIAGLFLPLGLVTGLLGINVGGIPLAESSWGFAVICLLLVGLAGFEVWLFRRLKWL